MVRTVVASVTNVVAVCIFLIRVVIIGAVVKVVEDTVAVSIKSSHGTCIRILVSVGVVRAVVASVADMVAVAIFLIRVCIVRTVVKVVEDTVVITVESIH